METVLSNVEQKKRNKRHWVKVIKSIHKRKIREIFVDDGTEAPPDRNDITEIFQEKSCFTCGRPLKYPQIKYCSKCK